MKELINHLLRNNTQEIVNRSLRNCHVMGLHSIMLLESPGKTIRLYVADIGHELHSNSDPFNREMTLGFHAHHCDLTLHVVEGVLGNTIVTEADPQHDFDFDLRKYRYTSAISTGKMGFELEEEFAGLDICGALVYRPGEVIAMNAKEIHTVTCDPDKVTAWLVYEGREDPTYENVLYTNVHMEDYVAPPELYGKMDLYEIMLLLSKAKLF